MAITKNENTGPISAEILDQMMAEVTAEVAEYLQQDVSALRKAVEDDAADDESEGSEGPSAPPDEESSAPDAGMEASPGEESAPDSPMMDEASAAPEGSAAHEGGEIEPAPSVEGLQAEYMKLDPEALQMHYIACKGALMASMGEGQPDMGAGPEASAGAPPPAAPPPAPEASAPMAMGEMSAGKEITNTDANGGEIEKGKSLGKSEMVAAKDAEIASLKDQLKKNEEAVIELALQLTKPLRKSVKGLSDLAFIPKTETENPKKVETLSKSEIVSKLREKSRTPNLKKSDRDLINQFTCGVEGVTVKDIEHLLKE